jgi:hypothetical protein
VTSAIVVHEYFSSLSCLLAENLWKCVHESLFDLKQASPYVTEENAFTRRRMRRKEQFHERTLEPEYDAVRMSLD